MILSAEQKQELQILIAETSEKLGQLRRRRLQIFITAEQKKSLQDYKSVLEQILNQK